MHGPAGHGVGAHLHAEMADITWRQNRPTYNTSGTTSGACVDPQSPAKPSALGQDRPMKPSGQAPALFEQLVGELPHGAPEYYDLASDPHQLDNLLASDPSRVEASPCE